MTLKHCLAALSLWGCLAASLAPSPVQAQLIVSDGFNDTPGPITGQGGGTGWAGNWTNSGSGADTVVSGGLTYTQGGVTLLSSGNKLMTSGSDVGAYRRPPTTFGPYGGNVNQDIWIGFLAAAPSAGDPTGYAGLSLFSSGTEVFFTGEALGTGMYGFQNHARAGLDGSAQVSGVSASTTTHFLALHLNFTASGTTEATLFIDPTPGVTPTRNPDVDKIFPSSFQFDQVRFQSGSSANALFFFDELRMGNTFQDISPVALPAPTLSGLSPATAPAGAPAFYLLVNGTGFVNGATVNWNGTPLVTTLVSSTQLKAAIPPSDVASVGTASVTATNPQSLASNALSFTTTTTSLRVAPGTLTRNASTKVITVPLTVTNTGYASAPSVKITAATLGGKVPKTKLPLGAGTLAAGASGHVSLAFPGTAGAKGKSVALTVSGTYTGGTFSQTSSVVLP